MKLNGAIRVEDEMLFYSEQFAVIQTSAAKRQLLDAESLVALKCAAQNSSISKIEIKESTDVQHRDQMFFFFSILLRPDQHAYKL
jgi:hypothetical protein